VYDIELRRVVLPEGGESMCNQKGTSVLGDASQVVGVEGQMVLDIGDILAEAILAELTGVVDVHRTDEACRGRGPRAVHGHDKRVHVCVEELD
jgi:hypothetical protein